MFFKMDFCGQTGKRKIQEHSVKMAVIEQHLYSITIKFETFMKGSSGNSSSVIVLHVRVCSLVFF